MLTKSQIVNELVERGVGNRVHVKNMLDELATLAAEQIAAGEKFTVPNIARLDFGYRAGARKGEQYTVPGTGEVKKREETKPASFRLKAAPAGSIKKSVPAVNSRAGKPLAAVFKEKAAARAARAAEKAQA